MSSSLIYVRLSTPSNSDDVDLGARLEAALKKQQQAGWGDIYVAIRDASVTLNGEVSTTRDRQFVVAVTRHVVGVERINDMLKVVSWRNSKPKSEADGDQSLSEKLKARFKSGKRTDHFKNVPVLSESLDDLTTAFRKDTSTKS
jgi:BON domain